MWAVAVAGGQPALTHPPHILSNNTRVHTKLPSPLTPLFIASHASPLTPAPSLPLTPYQPHQSSLKSDESKMEQLRKQEQQLDAAAEQVTQEVEQLTAKMDELKKQVSVSMWSLCVWAGGHGEVYSCLCA